MWDGERSRPPLASKGGCPWRFDRRGRLTTSMIEQKIEKPTCPACGSSAIRRAGVITRKRVPAAQLWRCACCSKRFFSPTTPRGRRGPGASKHVSRLLDGRTNGTSHSERPGTFTVSIRRPLVGDLEKMHALASGWGADVGSLAQFCSELLEVAVITFREQQVAAQKRRTPLVSPRPAPAEMQPISRRSKLSEGDIKKIRTLLAEGVVNQTALSRRYSVAQSTIARHVNGNGSH